VAPGRLRESRIFLPSATHIQSTFKVEIPIVRERSTGTKFSPSENLGGNRKGCIGKWMSGMVNKTSTRRSERKERNFASR